MKKITENSKKNHHYNFVRLAILLTFAILIIAVVQFASIVNKNTKTANTKAAEHLGFDFAAYNLPIPSDQGKQSTSILSERIKNNYKAKWSAQQLMYAERQLQKKGFRIERHLTTAWLWFENGGNSWADVYQYNCDDNAYLSDVGRFCTGNLNVSGNGQVSGFQIGDVVSSLPRIYDKLYSREELAFVMQRVVDNSGFASQQAWQYIGREETELLKKYLPNGKVPNDISFSKIAQFSGDLSHEEKQFYTFILAKDPLISVAMNNELSLNPDAGHSSLVWQLKKGTYCIWGYICPLEKQVLSNIVQSLYAFDTIPDNAKENRDSKCSKQKIESYTQCGCPGKNEFSEKDIVLVDKFKDSCTGELSYNCAEKQMTCQTRCITASVGKAACANNTGSNPEKPRATIPAVGSKDSPQALSFGKTTIMNAENSCTTTKPSGYGGPELPNANYCFVKENSTYASCQNNGECNGRGVGWCYAGYCIDKQ